MRKPTDGQLPLFGDGALRPAPRPEPRTEPDPPYCGTFTSWEASKAIAPSTATLRGQVLQFLMARGARGATDEEIQHALRLRSQTETPRRGELVRMGLVRDSGNRRHTSSGRQAVAWIAVVAAEPASGGER